MDDEGIVKNILRQLILKYKKQRAKIFSENQSLTSEMKDFIKTREDLMGLATKREIKIMQASINEMASKLRENDGIMNFLDDKINTLKGILKEDLSDVSLTLILDQPENLLRKNYSND